MGIFRFLESGKSKDDENDDVTKNLFAWDKESLRMLNQEELDTEFRFLSATLTRTLESGDELVEVFTEKGWEVPSDTALGRALRGQGSSSTEKRVLDLNDKPWQAEGVVKGRGGRNAIVAFVGASPSKLDEARGKAFCGPIGKTVKSVYLEPLGLSEEHVYMTNIVPVYLEDEGQPREPTEEEISEWSSHFKAEMEAVQPAFVVALGKTAASALDGHDEWVPHPRAVYKMGDSGEVARKMARLQESVANWLHNSENSVVASITKTDEERRLVYGVAYEPGVEDSDGNWSDAPEIEKMAHSWALNGMVVGDEHVTKADDVTIVESYVAPVDFELDGEEVQKGSWVVVAKVHSDERWEMVKSGEYTGFSFGGSAKIEPDQRLQ